MKKLAFAAALLCATAATPALADVPAVTVTGAPGTLANGPFTLGFAFTTANSFNVTGLGIFDADDDGLAEAHDVGLWDATGNLLGSTTVGAGTAGSLLSGFRFASVTPFTIGAGTYRVGALFNSGSADALFFPGTGTLTTASGVTYVGGAFAGGATLADPVVVSGTSPSYIGANVRLADVSAAVPEPATWGMMILGFGVVGASLRRRKATVRTGVRFA